jgi:demethylmenaquinone methyltransferase/2-methoxy-6-polyprenyl-1,4-benzoquinol methylase
MFSAIPARYDLTNRLLTAGLDQKWRRQAARECLRTSPGYVLDLCCGTGDLALEVARISAGGLKVAGLDFSGAMLKEARQKAGAFRLPALTGFIHGDVAELPFREDSFSAIAISFAFRNITYRNPLRTRYLAEILRVLSPGGAFIIVETSQPRHPLLRRAVHAYYRLSVAGMGALISGHPRAYRYLAASARRFYDPETVSGLLRDAGFRDVRTRPLLGGVAAVFVATK